MFINHVNLKGGRGLTKNHKIQRVYSKISRALIIYLNSKKIKNLPKHFQKFICCVGERGNFKFHQGGGGVQESLQMDHVVIYIWVLFRIQVKN